MLLDKSLVSKQYQSIDVALCPIGTLFVAGSWMMRFQCLTVIALVTLFGAPVFSTAADLSVAAQGSDDLSFSPVTAEPAPGYTTSLSASAQAWDATAEAWKLNTDMQEPHTVPVPEPGALNILLGTLAVLGCAGLARWWNNRF